MNERDRLPQVGIRVEPEFRAALKEAARQYHGGNESHLFRESARLYIAMRRRLGPQFEPFVSTVVPGHFPPADIAPADPVAVAS